MALAAASKDTRASLAGPPPSAPVPAQVSASEVTLRWGPPMSTGGFAICGYVVQAQIGGDGGFKEVIADTRVADPVAVVKRLTATTWYEFRVAAINSNGVGAWSEPSEPVLTITTTKAAGNQR